MKASLLRRDIPPRAAAIVVALALLATVVTGRERVDTPEAAAPPERPASAPPAVPEEDLDLARLARARREPNIRDVFATSVPPPPPVPAPLPTVEVKAEPPPAPAAPPLPFSYLGRMTKGDSTIVYMMRNQEMLLARAGETVDGVYRVESISDSAVQFVYLPLGTLQTLQLSAPR